MSRHKSDPIAHALDAYKALTAEQRCTFQYVISFNAEDPKPEFSPKPRVRNLRRDLSAPVEA